MQLRLSIFLCTHALITHILFIFLSLPVVTHILCIYISVHSHSSLSHSLYLSFSVSVFGVSVSVSLALSHLSLSFSLSLSPLLPLTKAVALVVALTLSSLPEGLFDGGAGATD